LTNTDHDRKHSLLIDSGAGYQARRHWNSMNSMSALQDADLGMQCPQPANGRNRFAVVSAPDVLVFN
jgi:hypothetical protein